MGRHDVRYSEPVRVCEVPSDTRTERFLATRPVDSARPVEGGTLDRIATVDEEALNHGWLCIRRAVRQAEDEWHLNEACRLRSQSLV